MNLNRLLLDYCGTFLHKQEENGSFGSGKNGPHQHRMTPARVTAHWAIAFAEAYRLTNDMDFYNCAYKAARYLLSGEVLHESGFFIKRHEPGKSDLNGLIGQAWCDEALIFVGQTLSVPDFVDYAKNNYMMHKIGRFGTWKTLDADGLSFRYENTFNQQVWMASIAASLANLNVIDRVDIDNFMSSLENTYLLGGNLYPLAICFTKNKFLIPLSRAKRYVMGERRSVKEAEVGYHLFVLTALARIRELGFGARYFEGGDFKKKLNFIFSDVFLRDLCNSKYGFQYNVPGFEIPYIYSQFRHLIEIKGACDRVKQMTRYQIDCHFRFLESEFAVNTVDPETLTSRIYEIHRIPEDQRMNTK